jgi:hypothetical protein
VATEAPVMVAMAAPMAPPISIPTRIDESMSMGYLLWVRWFVVFTWIMIAQAAMSVIGKNGIIFVLFFCYFLYFFADFVP